MIETVKNNSENIISFLEKIGFFLIKEQEKHEYKTFKKKDGSILTELDITSETLIKREIKKIFGNVKILSEENTFEENEIIAKEKFCFLLDPIDGTKNFNKGKDFTINLAFCIDKIPVISFIHNPRKKTILFGDTKTAYKKTNNQITKLKPNSTHLKDYKEYLNLAIGTQNFENKYFTSTIVKLMQQLKYNFSEKNLKAFSAMGKLLSFVDNDVNAFWSSNVCKDWDILPALPILKAINAYYYTNNPTIFNNNNFDSGVFIVANNEKLLDDLVYISAQTKNMVIT